MKFTRLGVRSCREALSHGRMSVACTPVLIVKSLKTELEITLELRDEVQRIIGCGSLLAPKTTKRLDVTLPRMEYPYELPPGITLGLNPGEEEP